jgi:hypothetical protein
VRLKIFGNRPGVPRGVGDFHDLCSNLINIPVAGGSGFASYRISESRRIQGYNTLKLLRHLLSVLPSSSYRSITIELLCNAREPVKSEKILSGLNDYAYRIT